MEPLRVPCKWVWEVAILKYPSYPVSGGIAGQQSPGGINTEAWSSRLGIGVRLTTLPCKKTFVENLLRKEILVEAKAHL
jgi:hypothetical protein